MIDQYNGQLLFANIDFLIRKQKRKIGEVETEAGVSAGYISRTSKEGGSKPGIDFIMNIAKVLGVSLDTLLTVDLSALTSTESYLLAFFNKLIHDTKDDLLPWEREYEAYLNTLTPDSNGNEGHPLFHLEEPVLLPDGSYQYSTYSVFESNTFGVDTIINGVCYNIRLKNGFHLYVMNIKRDSAHSSEASKDTAKEIWLTMDRYNRKYLCSDWDGAHLAPIVDNLYTTIQESFRRPQIGQDYRYIIDSFMKGDMEDDASKCPSFGAKDDDIPF